MAREIAIIFVNVEIDFQQEVKNKLRSALGEEVIIYSQVEQQNSNEINAEQVLIHIEPSGFSVNSAKINNWEPENISAENCANEIKEYLQKENLIQTENEPYTEQEKEAIQRRLRDLGYL